jgi:hypothetical protein
MPANKQMGFNSLFKGLIFVFIVIRFLWSCGFSNIVSP